MVLEEPRAAAAVPERPAWAAGPGLAHPCQRATVGAAPGRSAEALGGSNGLAVTSPPPDSPSEPLGNICRINML